MNKVQQIKSMKKQSGLTLIELSIAIVLGLVIVVGVLSAIQSARIKSQVKQAFDDIALISAATAEWRGNTAVYTGVTMTILNNLKLLPTTIAAGSGTNPWTGNYTATVNGTDSSKVDVTITNVPTGVGLQLERKIEPATSGGNSASVSGTTVTATF